MCAYNFSPGEKGHLPAKFKVFSLKQETADFCFLCFAAEAVLSNTAYFYAEHVNIQDCLAWQQAFQKLKYIQFHNST